MNTSKTDARLIRMLTRKGFIDLFWEELQAARIADPAVSRESIFNQLNEYYFSMTGMYRYIDYESFASSMKKK